MLKISPTFHAMNHNFNVDTEIIIMNVYKITFAIDNNQYNVYGAWRSKRISNQIRKMNELKPETKNKRTLCCFSIHIRCKCKCECEVVITK